MRLWSKRRCHHRQLEPLGAHWGGGEPFPAICPDCNAVCPWMTHKALEGGWVMAYGSPAWAGPRRIGGMS